MQQLSRNIYRACQQLSTQTRRQLLMATGLVLVCICITTMIEPFPSSTIDELTPSGYTIPVIITPGIDEPVLSDAEYVMLQSFIDMMDSVRVYDRPTYDMILKDHEGLLDSVRFVISLYPQQ